MNRGVSRALEERPEDRGRASPNLQAARHGDMGAPVGGEPVRQRQQIAGRCSEGAHLRLDGRTGPDACAGDDGLLMHVEPGTSVIEKLPGTLLRPLRTPEQNASHAPPGQTSRITGSYRGDHACSVNPFLSRGCNPLRYCDCFYSRDAKLNLVLPSPSRTAVCS